MIKVQIIGGLGNQMFQYAAARSLSEKLKTETILDISAFDKYDVHPLKLDKFNINGRFINKKTIIQKLLNVHALKKSLENLNQSINFLNSLFVIVWFL